MHINLYMGKIGIRLSVDLNLLGHSTIIFFQVIQKPICTSLTIIIEFIKNITPYTNI